MQVTIAGVFSVICMAVLLHHLLNPPVRTDYTAALLLGLAVLPWMIVFLESIGVGSAHAKFRRMVQGQIKQDKPSPTEPTPDLASGDLSGDSRRILATLWHYQRALDPTYVKRWTFAVNANAPEYFHYVEGLAELVGARLVAIARKSGQCMLTDAGIRFMESGDGPGDDAPRYHFPD